MKKITPVILCGGSGTRLWPLSRKSLPKQFIQLLDGKSLLQAAFERVSDLVGNNPIWTVSSEEHQFLVRESSESVGVTCNCILEPVGRNTAAAMAAAALNAKPEELLLFLPADHYIPDAKSFIETVREGVIAAKSGAFVTYGVQPSHPHTGYGYIQISESDSAVKPVHRFVEKPDRESAINYIESGDYYWNAGIFLVQARELVKALELYAPDIFKVVQGAVDAQKVDGHFVYLDEAAFKSCRSESIDYAVLEQHHNVMMVPFLGEWSDMGGWDALADLSNVDDSGNNIVGNGRVYHSSSTYIHASHRPVIALGAEELLIVDTTDAVFVADKSYVGMIKEVVADLQKDNVPQASEHRHVVRPWGEYDKIDEGHRFKVKRITVKPGASLSLQLHHHRAEHWIIVKGTARVTRGSDTFLLTENESTFIPVGTEHRLVNPGTIPLEMIEVQSGSYLGEDDIERFNDLYGRN